MTGLTVLRADPDEAAPGPPFAAHIDGEVEVVRCGRLAEATEVLADTDVDCVVTEYDLPDGTGLELIRHVRDRAPDTACILFTDADPGAVGGGPTAVTEYVAKGSPEAARRVAQLAGVAAERRTHTAYPLPETESDRLAALEQYDFDSAALRSALDRVTDLAARHFGVPIASVNVLTRDTQQFLACRGADWTETAREDAICTHAILSDGVTVIEDVAEDPRFADSDVLAEAGVRFYASAELTTEGDEPVGTLCVYDERPRTFTGEDEAHLELLAAEAMAWVEVHAREDREGTG
jgi:CheY-like chemotaxis protein